MLKLFADFVFHNARSR